MTHHSHKKFFRLSLFFSLILLSAIISCQSSETRVIERDFGRQGRLFSKVQGNLNFRQAVIVDVRPRFQFEMSRLPRSFHAWWKDWSLIGFQGDSLIRRKNHLQRLLALNGVDRLTSVFILGEGLKGQGEEFFLAATLLSLGVQRLSFITEVQVRSAVTSENLPSIENLPYWNEDIQFLFDCQNKNPIQADIIIDSTSTCISTQASDIGTSGTGLHGKCRLKDKLKNTLKDKRIRVLKPSRVFSKNLEVKYRLHPKKIQTRVFSPDSFWAYGLVLHLREQGYHSCVL